MEYANLDVFHEIWSIQKKAVPLHPLSLKESDRNDSIDTTTVGAMSDHPGG